MSDYCLLHLTPLIFSTYDVDPAVYPYSLETIYPAVACDPPNSIEEVSGVDVGLQAAYPNICPCKFIVASELPVLTILSLFSDQPVYPHFAIYPAAALKDPSIIELSLDKLESSLSPYPYLVICEYVLCSILASELTVRGRPRGVSVYRDLPWLMGRDHFRGERSREKAEVYTHGASCAGSYGNQVYTDTSALAEEA